MWQVWQCWQKTWRALCCCLLLLSVLHLQNDVLSLASLTDGSKEPSLKTGLAVAGALSSRPSRPLLFSLTRTSSAVAMVAQRSEKRTQKQRNVTHFNSNFNASSHNMMLSAALTANTNNINSNSAICSIIGQKQGFASLPAGVKNALASYLATLFVKIALQPFDTIKTVQQVARGSGQSIFSTGLSVLRQRGLVKGLWAGTWVSALGAAPSVGVYFGVFSAAKARLTPLLPLNQRSVAVGLSAALANSVAAVFRVPYEVLKQRLQSGAHRSLSEALTYTIREEGIVRLFGGGRLAVQILRDVPYAVLTAVLYDVLQRSLQALRQRQQTEKQTLLDTQTQSIQAQNKDAAKDAAPATDGSAADTKTTIKSKVSSKGRKVGGNEWVDAVSGAVAGGVSTLLTTPLDVVKTRLMASTSSEYASVGAAIAGIWAQEGVAGFFRGGGSRLLHKVPANALFFMCYELLRYLLGAVDTRSAQ